MNVFTAPLLIGLTTGLWTGLFVLLGSGDSRSVAFAQVTPDGTLSTTVTQTGNNFAIDNGDRSGNNLFHSFREFSVPTGGSAVFNNAVDIQTIFSRVTGGNISNIDGLIRANGSANLFLLNPSGILFGPNASLNIGGSFVGTTANGIQFTDGVAFSAANASGSPLLTMSVPIGLQMGSNPGAITNQSQTSGVGLQVPIGQTLALVGGNIALPGGALSVPDGHIALGSVGANETVAIAPSPSGWTFNYAGVQNFQDIQLTQEALVDTSGNAGGSIQIQGRRLSVSESRIKSYTEGTGNGGDLRVSTSEAISIRNGFLGTTVLETGSGRGGNVQISSPNIVLDEPSGLFSEVFGTGIFSDTYGLGAGGNLTIDSQRIELFGGSTNYYTYLSTDTYSSGQGGNLTITSPHILLTGRLSSITSDTYGLGAAGNLTIDSQTIELFGDDEDGNFPTILSTSAYSSGRGGNLTINANRFYAQGGNSRISANTFQGVTGGDAGDLVMNLQQLQLVNGPQIASGTFGSGNTGDVTINASESVDLYGFSSLVATGLYAAGEPGSTGNGGNVFINTGQLNVRHGAEVAVNMLGTGKAGNIIIRAGEIEVSEPIVDFTGTISGIVASLESQGSGTGGSIDIQANRLRLTNGGQILALTNGAGDAGSIVIRVNEIELDGSSPDVSGNSSELFRSSISARSSTDFDAGSIQITGDRLTLRDGAEITSSSTKAGNAGSLNLNIAQQFTANNGTLSIRNHDGMGGNIQLTAQQVQLQNNSLIDSSTSGQGNAGGVAVKATAIALTQSTINSQSTGSGNSGSLTIKATDNVTLQNGSQITSSSTGSGLGGTVDIAARSLFLNQNSQINASTVSSDGGNLRFTLAEVLLLRDRSLLNATAGGNGNGGNILLNAPVIVGLGNSDIIANAVQGRGGNIQITTDGIFGLKFRDQLTPDNDITASSTFGINGTVQINLLSVDPSSGLAQLPMNLADSSQQVAQGCAANQGSSFVITGRGGLPSNPMTQTSSDRPWTDTRNLFPYRNRQVTYIPQPTIPAPLLEATGWRRNVKGEVEVYATIGATSAPMAVTCALWTP